MFFKIYNNYHKKSFNKMNDFFQMKHYIEKAFCFFFHIICYNMEREMGDNMRLYNTLHKKIEPFTPHTPGEVTLYTCGPTVYHYAHIGNLRTYIFEDVLEKGLEYLGYNVKRAMNITDVGHMTSDADSGEDKMLKGAEREHKTVFEIAQFYTDSFFSDCEKLNIRKPLIVEKASDHIDRYIMMIEKMLEDGYAYQAEGNIYFDTSKASNYYELSGKNKEELMIGVRDTVEEDKAKRNPTDFGLWFTISKFQNQAMKWESPWGIGYPGWHIECSGLATLYLGEYLDIHCGGVDNIFPHHTNEIAQSEAFLGHPWCNYWIHGEHLNDNTGKMSKSKGEFLTVSLLEQKGFSPLVYRFFCLQSHYRNQLVFSYDAMDIAKNAYTKLTGKVRSLQSEPSGEIDAKLVLDYQKRFQEAIENDLNTSTMLTILYDVLKEQTSNATKLELIHSFESVLSLDLLKQQTIESADIKYIETQIELRAQAKQNKDFARADQIREELLKRGIMLKDTRTGSTYEKI